MAEKITYPFLPEDKCLTEHQLFDYIDGKLNATEMHLIEKHLLACEMCSDAIEGLEKVKHRDKVAAFFPGQLSKTIEKENDSDNETRKIIPLHPNRKYYAIAAGMVLIICVALYLKTDLSNDMESSKMAQLSQKDSTASIIVTPQQSANKEQQVVGNDAVVREAPKVNGPTTGDQQNHNSLGYYYDTLQNKRDASGRGKNIVFEDQTNAQSESGTTVADIPAERFALNEKSPGDAKQKPDLDLAKVEQKKAEADNNTDKGLESDLKTKDAVASDDYRSNIADKKETAGKANEKPASHVSQSVAPSVATGNAVPAMGGVATQPAVSDEEGTISTVTDSVSTSSPQFYPLKPSDKDLDLSYENGVKMLDSGQTTASLVFFDQVLTNPNHKYFEDAQWKKSIALIQLNRKAEAKVLLQQIENKGGKYQKQAKEELKKLN